MKLCPRTIRTHQNLEVSKYSTISYETNDPNDRGVGEFEGMIITEYKIMYQLSY